jgi:hypothetical protein
VVCL